MKQAGVMLIIKDGLILAVSRRYDKTIFGLPGGKFNPEPPDNDKDTKDTAVRETEEETSVVVKDCVFLYERVELGGGPNPVDYYSRCYYATDWEGTPQNSEEGEVKWLTAEELTSTKAAFGDYNRKTLDIFKKMYSDVFILGETPHKMPTPEEMGVSQDELKVRVKAPFSQESQDKLTEMLKQLNKGNE